MDFPILETGHNNLGERGCDLCVYRKEVTASIFGPGIRTATHSYTMNARSMIALRDLLFKHGITHVILHKSGIYWKLAYDILCDHFTIMVVNQRNLQDACC